MHISIGIPPDATDEHLTFARQLGCEGVVPVLNHPGRIPGEELWEYEDLIQFKQWIEGHGLRLEALQHVRTEFWSKVRMGEPGRDEQLENYLKTIRNVGRAGIPVLAHNFCLYPLYRTGTTSGRGGATVTTYDHDKAPREHAYGREISADEVWPTTSTSFALPSPSPRRPACGLPLIRTTRRRKA
jgi:mannonate dehydratase